MECHHSFITILNSRSWPSYPWHCYKRSLFNIFYSTSTYTLHQQPDEILFGCFVTTLNAAFEQQLALADEGYESGSDTIYMPTPLRKMPRIQHLSSIEHVSFNPDPVMPSSILQTPPRLVCRQLTFSPSDNSDTSEDAPPTPRETPADAQVYLDGEEGKDFQIVPLDDENWTTEEVPDRALCIHEHALLHGLCLYLCPYANYLLPSYSNSMDLSDISDF